MKFHKHLIYFVILLFAVLISSCESIAKASEAQEAAKEEFTPEGEYYIGRAVAANITTTYKPYTSNVNLTNYLNQICKAITVCSSKPDLYNGYHLMILDTEEVNAFATSGGHVFITKGLLRSANSEDALAGIIAHEIAHIQLQHNILAIQKSRKTSANVATGIAAANVLSTVIGVASNNESVQNATQAFSASVNDFSDSINDAIGELVNKGYSRDQEFQADDLALELMAAAGYEPSSFIEMLRNLKTSQGKVSGGFNNTHPTPDARIKNAETSLSKYSVLDTRGYRTNRFQTYMTKI